MVKISSFGFKHGTPDRSSGLIIDARGLPNPHNISRLRGMTGKDSEVQEFVAASDLSGSLLTRGAAAALGGADVLFGCVGGRHRSVALAEALVESLRKKGLEVTIEHREL